MPDCVHYDSDIPEPYAFKIFSRGIGHGECPFLSVTPEQKGLHNVRDYRSEPEFLEPAFPVKLVDGKEGIRQQSDTGEAVFTTDLFSRTLMSQIEDNKAYRRRRQMEKKYGLQI
jgi:hypothetical protein